MVLKRITKKLELEFPNSSVRVKSFAGEHLGHGATGAHIQVEVQSEKFKGKTVLEQHRQIHKTLQKEMEDGTIHALKIKTKE